MERPKSRSKTSDGRRLKGREGQSAAEGTARAPPHRPGRRLCPLRPTPLPLRGARETSPTRRPPPHAKVSPPGTEIVLFFPSCHTAGTPTAPGGRAPPSPAAQHYQEPLHRAPPSSGGKKARLPAPLRAEHSTAATHHRPGPQPAREPAGKERSHQSAKRFPRRSLTRAGGQAAAAALPVARGPPPITSLTHSPD